LLRTRYRGVGLFLSFTASREIVYHAGGCGRAQIWRWAWGLGGIRYKTAPWISADPIWTVLFCARDFEVQKLASSTWLLKTSLICNVQFSKPLSSAPCLKLDYPIVFFDTTNTSDSKKGQSSEDGSNGQQYAPFHTAKKMMASSKFLSMSTERTRSRYVVFLLSHRQYHPTA